MLQVAEDKSVEETLPIRQDVEGDVNVKAWAKGIKQMETHEQKSKTHIVEANSSHVFRVKI